MSTEAHAHKSSELSILEVDPITGSVLGAPFAPPQDALDRVLDNKGFEALTLASGRALGLDDQIYVVTTPEYALSGDDETHHASTRGHWMKVAHRPAAPVFYNELHRVGT